MQATRSGVAQPRRGDKRLHRRPTNDQRTPEGHATRGNHPTRTRLEQAPADHVPSRSGRRRELYPGSHRSRCEPLDSPGSCRPTENRADRLVGVLADYHYVSMRYYGDDDVDDIP